MITATKMVSVINFCYFTNCLPLCASVCGTIYTAPAKSAWPDDSNKLSDAFSMSLFGGGGGGVCVCDTEYLAPFLFPYWSEDVKALDI